MKKFLKIILFVFLANGLFAQSYIFYSDITNDNIERAGLDGSSVTTVVSSTTTVRGLAVDLINGHIYYLDDTDDKIVRTDLDGSNPVDLVTSGITGPKCIALDVKGGKMYWTDISTDDIKRANLDGSSVETVIPLLSTDNAYGIALDLENNKMYWTEQGTDFIKRANLDGTGIETLVTGLNNPYGIALDVANNYMYWIEQTDDVIGRATLTGGSPTDLVTLSSTVTGRDIAIDFINSKLYWTDTGNDKISRCNLSDGSNIEDIVTSTNVGDSYGLALYNVGPGTTFTGTANWSSAGNWNNGVPNSSSTNVVINGNCTVDGSYTVKDLGVTSSGSLTVNSSASLTVSGAILNDAGNSGIVLSSDASNTASLIVSETSTGNITAERYMTGAATGWHLTGVPVVGQGINDLVTDAGNSFSTNTTQYGLGIYNEASDTWTTYTTATAPAAGNLTAGVGYETNRSADGDITYIGSLSIAQVDVPIVRTGNGWNLLGNPYPCSINANSTGDVTNNFLTVNEDQFDNTGSYVALYVWNSSSSQYDILNHSSTGTPYIPNGQAFFVKSKSGGGTMSFTTAMRTHQTGATFKSGTANPNIILKADNGESTRSTEFRFVEGTTFGLDPGYDAGLFNGKTDEFVLASRLMQGNDIDFALQCFSTDDFESVIVPIELNSSTSTVEFSVETTNLPSNIKVYLEDKQDNSFNLLNEDQTYTAQVNIGENTDRFYLHTSLQALDQLSELTEGEYDIVPNLKNSSLTIKGVLDGDLFVKVYDISGKLVFEKQITSNEVFLPYMATGIYVVKLIGEGVNYTQKVNWIK